MYGQKAKLPKDLRPAEDGTVLPLTYLDNVNADVLNTLTAIQKMLNLTVNTNIHPAQLHQECNFDRRNTSNQEITDDSIVYIILNERRLRWLGHVKRMRPGRIPKDLLYGELVSEKRKTSLPRLRFKDVCQRDLKAARIRTSDWKCKAEDRLTQLSKRT